MYCLWVNQKDKYGAANAISKKPKSLDIYEVESYIQSPALNGIFRLLMPKWKQTDHGAFGKVLYG